jgi:serine/threonine protein kinase
MEIGNIKSWRSAGTPFPKSGQGEARKVTRVGDTAGALFVLKRMHPAQARKPDRQERFKREIEALRKLDDPNILKIVDYGDDERGTPYLVTPYCKNGTLEDLPTETVTETVKRFLEICRGVAHAHESGIVHRDLKPKNIFLGESYSPIVGDFGLCFLLDDQAGDHRVTDTLEVAAPRWFGAPEAREGRLEDVTPAGDVYSLGKLLHWMFSRKIFDRENHRSERNKLGRGLGDRREFEVIHELLDKMIVEQPLARFQSASIVVEAVAGLIGVLEANGRPILIDFAHRCSFCGQGQYQFQNGPEDEYRNAAGAQALGITAPQYRSPAQFRHNFFMIAICDKCSHVQFFRPDVVKGARELWLRKRE